jgi:hypothetical protein
MDVKLEPFYLKKTLIYLYIVKKLDKKLEWNSQLLKRATTKYLITAFDHFNNQSGQFALKTQPRCRLTMINFFQLGMAKSSYGWSPLWLHHKIDQKENLDRMCTARDCWCWTWVMTLMWRRLRYGLYVIKLIFLSICWFRSLLFVINLIYLSIYLLICIHVECYQAHLSDM